MICDQMISDQMMELDRREAHAGRVGKGCSGERGQEHVDETGHDGPVKRQRVGGLHVGV